MGDLFELTGTMDQDLDIAGVQYFVKVKYRDLNKLVDQTVGLQNQAMVKKLSLYQEIVFDQINSKV